MANHNLSKGLFGRPSNQSDLPAAFKERYRFSRLFISFYILTMGSFVVIMLVADFITSVVTKNASDEYTRRFMSGTISLIEEELSRYPEKQWSEAIKSIDEKFIYKVELHDRSRLNLSQAQLLGLHQGGIALDTKGEILYHTVGSTPWVLVVEPKSLDSNFTNRYGVSLEFHVRLMAWFLIGICFAIAIWVWLRPFWRDLEAIRQTARNLGAGQLEARAPAAKSAPFQLMSDTLNAMADRIQQLIASQNELTGSISHELRTPIARMRFALEILTETEIKSEKERMWSMMGRDLDELEGLIDASLTYSRFGSETQEINPVMTELRPWLEDQIESLRVLGRNIEMKLYTKTLAEGAKVCLDRRTMPFAIKNLLRNATKYAKNRINIIAEIRGRNAYIYVDDDGIGVPDEERERIFHAFSRLDRSRDRNTGGYGLGLAIARQVLELHGGKVTVSTSPLGGARFTLKWPIEFAETDIPQHKKNHSQSYD